MVSDPKLEQNGPFIHKETSFKTPYISCLIMVHGHHAKYLSNIYPFLDWTVLSLKYSNAHLPQSEFMGSSFCVL